MFPPTSTSSSIPGFRTEAAVTSFLKSRETNQGSPTSEQLVDIFKVLSDPERNLQNVPPPPPPPTSSSSAPNGHHWFCSLTPFPNVQTPIATYLIYFFSFHRKLTAAEYMDQLETVLSGCSSCARGFIAAKRRFQRMYICSFPPGVQDGFMKAVDKWQVDLAMKSRASGPGEGKSVLDLPSASFQLLFADGGRNLFVQQPLIADQLKEAILNAAPASNSTLTSTSTSTSPSFIVVDNLISHGLLPGLLDIYTDPARFFKPLSQEETQRIASWAAFQVSACRINSGALSSSTAPTPTPPPVTAVDWEMLHFSESWMALLSCAKKEGDRLIEIDVDVDVEENTRSGSEGGGRTQTWDLIRDILVYGSISRDAIVTGVLASSPPSPNPNPTLTSTSISISTATSAGDRSSSASANIIKLLHGFLSSRSSFPLFTILIDIFTALLRACHTDRIWLSADPSLEFPLVIFGEIKDNPLFKKMLEDFYTTGGCEKGKEEEPLGWLSDFLKSLRALEGSHLGNPEIDGVGFQEGLARVANWCFEDLGNRRMEEKLRAGAINAGLKTLLSLLDLSQIDRAARELCESAFLRVLDVHSATITTVALNAIDHPSPVWDKAKLSAIKLLYAALQQDGNVVRDRITYLGMRANMARKKISVDDKAAFPVVTINTSLWKKTYESTNSVDCVALLMRGILRSAHLSTPHGSAWSHQMLEHWKEDGQWSKSVLAVKGAMVTMRGSFGGKLSSFAATSDANVLRSLWSTDRIPEVAMRLLLCSDVEVHDAIIGLVQTTFDDVDVRVDCIRAILANYPVGAMTGLRQYLEKWTQDADDLPSAVESARWQVRCFTDIIEVLCRQNDEGESAFLRDQKFLETKTPLGNMRKDVYQLWSNMTQSLAKIYRLTPKWAVFYDNDEMTDWMNDALIFGRYMVEETRTFEAAVTKEQQITSESPKTLSHVGQRLVAKLEPLLESILSWLRLTDIETLHQSFELIKMLLIRFQRASGSTVLSETLSNSIKTLDNFTRRSKGHKCKLDDSQLSELADLIAPFREGEISDDEVEYISENTKPLEISKTAKGVTADKPAAIHGKNAFAQMMQNAAKGKQSTPSSRSVINIDDADQEFEDAFSKLSSRQLNNMEKNARSEQLARQMRRAETKVVRDAKERARKSELDSRFPKTSSKGLLGKIRKEVAVERREKAQVMPERRKVYPPQIRDASARVVRAPSPETDSSAESSDDDQGGLSALTGLQRTPEKRLERIVPKFKFLKAGAHPSAMSAAERQRQNAYITKMRLRPDLSDFFRQILMWSEKDGPPSDRLVKVPQSFKSAQDLQAVFEPLLLEELWGQSVKQLEDAVNDPPIYVPVEVAARFYTDDFIDVELVVPGRTPDMWNVNDMDLCILQSKEGRTVIVKVQGFKRGQKNQAINVRLHNSRDVPGMTVKSKWTIRKHISLTTAVRECAALKGLPYYEADLLDAILNATPAKLPEIADHIVESAKVAYQVNDPQARVIMGAMKVQGFVLIQGPPGTGKTKTISGLAGRFLDQRVTAVTVDKQGPQKLLICAPSNAAIDEVTRRLKDGVPSKSGSFVVPKVVRVGAESSINAAVKDVSLDTLVEARVSAVRASRGGDKGSDIVRAEQALQSIKAMRDSKVAELASVGDNEEKRKAIEGELQALQQQRIARSQELNRARDAARDMGRQLDGARREAREKILAEADIICCTLAGAGADAIASFEFETVIIDEAAQAVELDALIPLKYRCKRAILVGDPKQLPPTVMSTRVTNLGYDRSLFVRMAHDHPDDMHLLSIQYRMHPDISQLPSKVFYDGKLVDGPDMAEKTKAPWHVRPIFGTYRFFNVNGQESSGRGHSLKNEAEINAIISLYRSLRDQYGSSDRLMGKIGIISMYKDQVNLLKRKFRDIFGDQAFDDIDFGTVDGFQGQEKDIIILSCVRSGAHLRAIGFLSDQRRMNVALTRAKSSLFVFGNGPTLERCDKHWSMIVGNARQRNFYFEYNPGMFICSASSSLPTPPAVQPNRLPPTKPAAVLKAEQAPVGVRALGKPASVSIPKTVPLKRSQPSDLEDGELLEPKKKKRKNKEKNTEMDEERDPGKEKAKDKGDVKVKQDITNPANLSRPTRPSVPISISKTPSPQPENDIGFVRNNPTTKIRLANGREINGSISGGVNKPRIPVSLPPPKPPGVGPPPPPKQGSSVLFIKKKKTNRPPAQQQQQNGPVPIGPPGPPGPNGRPSTSR